MQIHMQYIAMHLNVLSTIAEGNKQQTIKQSIQSKMFKEYDIPKSTTKNEK